MLCDPSQSLSCPDVYCANSNITFTVCQFSRNIQQVTNSKNATKLQFESCPDSSHLSCNLFKNCFSVLSYVNQIGLNDPLVSSNSASKSNNYFPRCVNGHAPIETTSKVNSTLTSASTQVSSASCLIASQQNLLTSMLLFICFLSFLLSKRST